jgi:hypothetical protein
VKYETTVCASFIKLSPGNSGRVMAAAMTLRVHHSVDRREHEFGFYSQYSLLSGHLLCYAELNDGLYQVPFHSTARECKAHEN